MAEDQVGGFTETPREARQATGRAGKLIPSTEFDGRTVLASNGQAIGAAEGIDIDMGSWRVDSLTVRLNRDMAKPLGLKSGMFRSPTIHISIDEVQSVADAILLTVTVDELRRKIAQAEADAKAERSVH